MKTLVEKLRALHAIYGRSAVEEAADEIEQKDKRIAELEAEVKRLVCSLDMFQVAEHSHIERIAELQREVIGGDLSIKLLKNELVAATGHKVDAGIYKGCCEEVAKLRKRITKLEKSLNKHYTTYAGPN